MNDKSLSRCYSDATARIHTITTLLYEDLHTKEGTPIRDSSCVKRLTQECLKDIREEIDFIRTASKEAEESR